MDNPQSLIHKQISENLRKILGQNIDELLRSKDSINFLEIKQEVEFTIELFKSLSLIKMGNFPFFILDRTAYISTTFLNKFADIRGFDPTKLDKSINAKKIELINEIKELFISFYKEFLPIISHSIIKSTNFDALKQETEISIAAIKEKVVESKKLIEEHKFILSKETIGKYTEIFKKEAEDHESHAIKWLLGAIVIILGIFMFTAYIWRISYAGISNYEMVQFALTKVIIFSTLFTALVWSGRNYRSHRHNYIVNKHRHNALITFDAFIKSANSNETKDHVLMRSTETIFSIINSGYLSKDSDSEGSTKIFEIFRNALTKSND